MAILPFAYPDLISLVISTIVLWISAKVLGSRLGVLGAFAISVVAAFIGIILASAFPGSSVLVITLMSFITIVLLISAFGNVGILHAVLIAIFPSLVLLFLGLIIFPILFAV